MRVVGYVREPVIRDSAETAFSQSERIRKWVSSNGYKLVATCHDSEPLRRDGLQTLISIIAGGGAEIVVLPTLETLSQDKITQEILLSLLSAHGAAVASTNEADLEALIEATADPGRRLIRQILHRQTDLNTLLETTARPDRDDGTSDPQEPDDSDVPVVILEEHDSISSASESNIQ